MTKSRDHFFNVLTKINDTTLETFVNDLGPSETAHNDRARILRNGLVISAYSTLEAYLSHRIDEVVSTLGSGTLRYTGFHEKTREMLTKKALEGLLTKAKLSEASSRLTVVESGIDAISEYKNEPPTFTSLGFSPTGSNITETDVRTFLKDLRIVDPWDKLTSICDQISTRPLSLEDDVKNFKQARHNAAHNSFSNIPINDLINYVRTALVFGAAFDILVTNTVNAYKTARHANQAISDANRIHVQYRFADQDISGIFKEHIQGRRNIKKYPNQETAKNGLLARKDMRFKIIRDDTFLPLYLI